MRVKETKIHSNMLYILSLMNRLATHVIYCTISRNTEKNVNMAYDVIYDVN